MFICEIWLFVWYFSQFCTSDMSKYGYLEVFQRVPSILMITRVDCTLKTKQKRTAKIKKISRQTQTITRIISSSQTGDHSAILSKVDATSISPIFFFILQNKIKQEAEWAAATQVTILLKTIYTWT